ncbi:MAG: hypothetical protein ACYS1A_06390 [Planctomycetota bacterium]|jgi:hypothetical protein
MWRKLYIIFVIAVLGCLLLTGCKKESPDTETAKTTAEYEAEAEQDIDKSNMAAELERIEKEMAAEEQAQP